jgi:hypothetical protein
MATIRKSLTKDIFVVELPDDGHVKGTTCRMHTVK